MAGPQLWSFTDLEFHALWTGATGELGLPFPFHFTARTLDPQKFRFDQRQARTELRERLGETFDPVLDALAHPDIRVVLSGSDHREGEEPHSVVRLLGARRESAGYVVSALPGESFWHSGGFTVTECDAVRLADELVAELPGAPAGSRGETVLPRRAGVPDQGEARPRKVPTVRDSFAATESERGSAFLAAPVSCVGTIHVEQGSSIYGPRGITRRRMGWRDLLDDGRYLIREAATPVAAPADTELLKGAINSMVAQVVRVIKDERRRR
ncbi:ESX secretion-associated protein EspG [Nocardia sp. NPDC050193]